MNAADARSQWTIQSGAAIQTVDSGARSLAPSTLDWQPTGQKGFWIKPLFEDVVRGEKTMIMKADPGAFAPIHVHPGEFEQVFVLEGSFTDENGTLHAGDYCCRAPDAAHSATSETGYTVLLIYTRRDPAQA